MPLMSRAVLWTLVLLGLPQVAAAAAIGVAAEPMVAVGGAPLERAEAPASSPPGLDLRIKPAPLPPSQHRPYGAAAIESDWADRVTEQDAAGRGLSFGLEVKPRSRIGALARQDEAEDPGIGDQLQRLIERPVFGLRGRYRF
jgi:hypothetical protein